MPRYGFNHLWMYAADRRASAEPPDLKVLDFQQKWGLKFVRVPTDYRFWTTAHDYFKPDERVWEILDGYVASCLERGLHLSLNLHRAPGYCINDNGIERHNLWKDAVAQDAFVFLWESFARRWKGVPGDSLSFDLLNEPPNIGQYGMTRKVHEGLMRRTVTAIRAVDPDRGIVIDGLAGGNLAVPELGDLGVIQSARGYQPMAVTHFRADWCEETRGLPYPSYPGTVWDGRVWDRGTIERHFAPWRELRSAGTEVHVGEFGCYNAVENDLALRWYGDILSVFRDSGWGYSLWNFSGPFGIAEHGRPGARYEKLDGFMVDRDLFESYIGNRV
jgi:endoglucanase